MRLAILSDIHGNLVALDAVLTRVEREDPDRLWVLGDLAAFGPRPAECVRRVRELVDRWGDRLGLVSGNTDRYLVTGERRAVFPPVTAETFGGLADDWRSRDLTLDWAVSRLDWDEYVFLRDLPDEPLRLDTPAGPVVGYHGLPGDDEGWLAPDTDLPNDDWARAFGDLSGGLGVGGHTHEPMDRRHAGWRLLNAGSVGAPRTGGAAEWLVLDLDEKAGTVEARPETTPYDRDAALRDLRARVPDLADWMADKMNFPSL